ncbi:uncharacterized protein LOC120352928 [Nilaparvata lugens]|uniref:uncharacterized protein LOC120352928 n=1 Tax=Nilaparvata lugens TaxID=108931 RepID=UPI00193E8379|nr:uncharacterized protein LOC120352928 [Nilaparvata lugens]
MRFKLLCLSEHWMCLDDLKLFKIAGYELVAYFCRSEFQCGGVAIYIDTSVIAHFACIDISMHCVEKEHEFACVSLLHAKLYIITVYRSPAGCLQNFFNSLEGLVVQLASLNPGFNIIVGGDFNIDVLKADHRTREFVNLLRSLDLYVANWQPTRFDACLDNVITNLNIGNNISCSIVNPLLSDHLALGCNVELPTSTYPASIPAGRDRLTWVRPITQGGRERFLHYLTLIDWSFLKDHPDAQPNFTAFFDRLLTGFNNCFPLKRFLSGRPGKRGALWITDDLLDLRDLVLMAYERFRADRLLSSKRTYMGLRRSYQRAARAARMRYNSELIDRAPNRCKAAWGIIRAAAGVPAPGAVPVSADDLHDAWTSSIRGICEGIRASPVVAADLLSASVRPPALRLLTWRRITCDDVTRVVNCLSNSASKDIYGMTSATIKDVLALIVSPLTVCINLCFQQSVFPSQLKISKTVPVFKKGDRHDPTNYRPISILPIISKIFEILIAEQLLAYCDQCGLFATTQFGFRKNRSTTDAVDFLLSKIFDCFEARGLAGLTLCDLSKAFDTMDHAILVDKLRHYGVGPSPLKLIQAYLGGRRQAVLANGVLSEIRDCVDCGVPQGSVLGPLLFLISVNDIAQVDGRCVVCYADDTTFFNAGREMGGLRAAMVETGAFASDWFSANRFLLNEDKTQSIVFSLRNGNEYNFAPVKLLGFTLDRKLSWGEHIETVCARLSRVVFLLRGLKHSVPPHYLKMCYFGFFQSVILYGLPLWGGATDVARVLRLQKRALRIICGAGRLAHCRPLFIKERILTVFSLYVLHTLCRTHANVGLLVTRQSFHPYETRGRLRLDLPYQRLSRTRTGLAHMSISLYNRLPLLARDLPAVRFRGALRSLLTDHPLYSLREFCMLESSVVSAYFRI